MPPNRQSGELSALTADSRPAEADRSKAEDREREEAAERTKGAVGKEGERVPGLR